MVAEKRRDARGAVRRAGRRADVAARSSSSSRRARSTAASATARARWRRHRVRYPLWYELRPLAARLRGRRAPSRFDLWEAVRLHDPLRQSARDAPEESPLSAVDHGGRRGAAADDDHLGDRRRQPAGRRRARRDLPRTSSRQRDSARSRARGRVHRDAGTAARERGALSRALKATLSRICRSCGAATSRASIRRRCSNAPYVDWMVRGQGEETFVELLDVLDGTRDPRTVRGLSFREADGTHWIGQERRWKGPDELPAPPYHKIRGRRLSPPDLPRTRGRASTRRRSAVRTAASSAA